jgi:hypothetical protein
MKTRARFVVALLGLSTLHAIAPSVANAQEPRLVGRISDPARTRVQSIVDSALAVGLPIEPIVDRALEGAAKGAPGDLIVSAVRRLWGELRIAREAFGDGASPGELSAGASALRAGASSADLAELRARRPGQPLTVAAAVLADLVAVGVPTDTAITAVLALAAGAGDSEYIAFRRNVERDIALGASPSAALGVRLGAAAAAETFDAASTGRTPQPTKRKP